MPCAINQNGRKRALSLKLFGSVYRPPNRQRNFYSGLGIWHESVFWNETVFWLFYVNGVGAVGA
jgi:hypothetical protein